MRAISSFSLEAGTSTFWCRARIALRIRVSISATGSVNFIRFASPQPPVLSAFSGEPATARVPNHLPRRLRNPRNLPAQRQPTETQTAQPELAQERPRPPANLAAVVPPRRELRPRLLLVARLLEHFLDLRVFN